MGSYASVLDDISYPIAVEYYYQGSGSTPSMPAPVNSSQGTYIELALVDTNPQTAVLIVPAPGDPRRTNGLRDATAALISNYGSGAPVGGVVQSGKYSLSLAIAVTVETSTVTTDGAYNKLQLQYASKDIFTGATAGSVNQYNASDFSSYATVGTIPLIDNTTDVANMGYSPQDLTNILNAIQRLGKGLELHNYGQPTAEFYEYYADSQNWLTALNKAQGLGEFSAASGGSSAATAGVKNA